MIMLLRCILLSVFRKNYSHQNLKKRVIELSTMTFNCRRESIVSDSDMSASALMEKYQELKLIYVMRVLFTEIMVYVCMYID